MANPTPGLTAFDQIRESSMADEGGAAGAWMERETDDVRFDPFAGAPIPLVRRIRRGIELRALRGVGVVVATGLGVFLAGLIAKR